MFQQRKEYPLHNYLRSVRVALHEAEFLPHLMRTPPIIYLPGKV